MKQKLTVLVMALALLCTLLSGCKSMPDEMMDAVTAFGDQVARISAQTEEAGKLIEKAQNVLNSGKPVSDVTTTSKLQGVIETVKEKVQFEVPKRPASLNAINEKVEELKGIDFTSYLDQLKGATEDVVESQEDYAMNDTEVTQVNGVWGVYEDGKLTDYTGIAQNQYGSWYVKDGKVDFTFTGSYDFAGKTFNVVTGEVKA